MTTTEKPKLPGSLNANRRLSQWIRIHADGSVEIRPGKVDIGQGISTALAQIAADELDVAPSRIRMVRASTASSPDEGVTSGSQSIQESGTALRYAAAEARAIYLKAAADKLGVAPDALSVEDGAIRGPGNAATSYWELADDALLDREATAGAPPKAAAARKLAGLDCDVVVNPALLGQVDQDHHSGEQTKRGELDGFDRQFLVVLTNEEHHDRGTEQGHLGPVDPFARDQGEDDQKCCDCQCQIPSLCSAPVEGGEVVNQA